MLDQEPTPGGLVPVPAVRAGKFHTAHKLTREAVRGHFAPWPTAHPDPWSGHYVEMARQDAGAVSSPTQVSGTGMNSPRNMGPC